MNDAAAFRRAAALAAEPVLAGVLAFLNPEREETRIVGGAVRNALIDVPVQDVDLGTTLTPDQVTRLAKAAGWQVVPTGIEHGTVTLVQAGRSFEVTTLREDIETDGRRAVVRFGRDFSHDAARRDFTINALSLGQDGRIHDYFGGLDDLAARRVRFIGDAGQRLREDYLRGLRFFRFSAAYGHGALDEAGLAAVIQHRAGFTQLSRERVRQEFLKLLVAEAALPVIEIAEVNGLLGEMLGFPLEVPVFRAALRLSAQEKQPLDALARLAALARNHAGDGAAAWQARLRLSNAEIRTLHRLYAVRVAGDASPRLMAYRFGEDAVAGLVLRTAVGIDPVAGLATRLTGAMVPPVFRISGADFVAAGLHPGPIIGKALAEVEQRWIIEGFPDGREAQLGLVEAVVKDLD